MRSVTGMAGARIGNYLTAMSRAKRACLSNLEDTMHIDCFDREIVSEHMAGAGASTVVLMCCVAGELEVPGSCSAEDVGP